VLSNLSLAGNAPFSSADKLGRERRRKWQGRKVSKLTRRTTVSSLVDAEFGYDLNDNILYRQNVQAVTGRDDLLRYDALDRVVKHDRGTLNGTKTVITGQSKKLAQNWRRDQSGNWWRFERQQNPPGGAKLNQFRRHSRTDHIRDLITGGTAAWPDPKHDPVGNMTRMPQPDSPTSNYFARYDAWNRLTELSDRSGRKFRYEYDGLGRRTLQRSWIGFSSEVRHYYYDQAGRVITEGVEQGTQIVLDREYIWDVNSAQRLICRIRHDPPGEPPGTEERLYALHDVLGNVVALVDEAGDVKERYLYDPQGGVTYLNPDFTDKAQQESAFDWEYLFAGMRRDGGSGLYFTGGGYYHFALGRILPSGPISVLPESQLNAYVQDFPFGAWRPPSPLGTNPLEPLLKWASDQAPWIKFTVGAAAMGATAISVGALIVINPYNPYPYFMAVGAICGGVQGGIEASLAGGDFSDVMLTAGLGAAFGAIAPWGGIGALAGSAAFAGVAVAAGKDRDSIATAWQWGGLVGGLAGDFTGAARAAIKFGARRALQAGVIHVGPDLLGAGAGAIIGYRLEGTATGALHGATLGMMAGGVAGGLARGLPSVRRALEPLSARSRQPMALFGRIDPRNYVYDPSVAGMFAPPLRYDPITRIFRSVDPAELADIRLVHGFRPKPAAYEGKLFTETARQAAAESRLLFGLDVGRIQAEFFPDVSRTEIIEAFGADLVRSIVEARLRRSIVTQFARRHTADYNGYLIGVSPEQLDLLNRSIVRLRVFWRASPLP
jgi:YD repeat-containing protein